MNAASETDFQKFANHFGGEADLSELRVPGSPFHWVVEILDGLRSLIDHYEGDRNRLGRTYHATSGIFESMEINGAADQGLNNYVFGISFGAVLRLFHAQLVLGRNEIGDVEKNFLSYLLGADPNESEPEYAEEVLGTYISPDSLIGVRDRTFFSVGFVFMHEAFHTLLGHTDYVRQVNGLCMDELVLEREEAPNNVIMQAMELDADGAAFSNFWLTLRQSPRFGVCRDPNPDSSDRIAEATMAGMLALIALEMRRAKYTTSRELTHPFPSRRVASSVRLLATLERRGVLPKGVRGKLAEKARNYQKALYGQPVAPLFDVITGDRDVSPDDADRLSELIAIHRNELGLLDDASFALRVKMPK